MKKLLLTLGATTAIVAPVASVVACGNAKGTTPGQTPGQAGPQNAGPTNQGGGLRNIAPGKAAPVGPAVHADVSALSIFTESVITENAYVQGFDAVAKPNTVQTFKVFDNGLFKIKIAQSLIGLGKFYKDEAAAKLEATTIANTINIGPAITHLEKGIQIIDSQNVASLGGNLGVQIAINNNNGSANDLGIINEASLIDHEYGHHETLYDFQSVLGKDIIKADNSDPNTLQGAMLQGLRNAGYDKLADVEARYNSLIKDDLSFMFSKPSDLPTAYSLPTTSHSVFKATNYPFNPAEMATRVLNVLSCRTDLSPMDLYGAGTDGSYVNVDGTLKPIGFGLPAAFVSDATMRNHAGEAIFGTGKDGSRVDKLINFYMKDIFGLGSGKIHLSGDANNGGKVTELNVSSFGATEGLKTLEIQDGTGNIVKTIPVTSYNSRFGFKNELITNKWTRTFNNEVQNASMANLNLDVSYGKTFKLIGKDAANKEVDLSSLSIGNMSDVANAMTWGTTFLKVEGTHLVIGQ